MTKKIWKIVPNYFNYFVSNYGDIKSFARNKPVLLSSSFRKDYLIVGLSSKGICRTLGVHQIVAMAFLNHVPCGHEIEVDHKNNIKTDNRLDNLQLLTNAKHKDKSYVVGSSGYKGVFKSRGRWASQIKNNGKRIYLGIFNTELEASIYYENAVLAIKNGTEIITNKHIPSSKHNGVMFDSKYGNWKSQITLNGKSIFLGRFENEDDAGKCSSDAFLAFEKGEDIIRCLARPKTNKYIGVSFHKNLNKWRARVGIGFNKRKHLGNYNTEEEAYQAIIAYNKINNVI